MRNETKYPDAEHYRPERFLEPGWPTYQEPLTQFPTIKGMSSFGYGQRQCLGMTLTQDELIVACGAILWAFNLKKKVDPLTGKEIDIDTKASNSLLIVKPDKYSMAFEPRSEKRRQEIIDNWTESETRDNEERSTFLREAELKRAGEMTL